MADNLRQRLVEILDHGNDATGLMQAQEDADDVLKILRAELAERDDRWITLLAEGVALGRGDITVEEFRKRVGRSDG